MDIRNLLLYIVTVLIWGSTWLAITWQLGVVDPLVSIFYRFGLSAVIILAYCVLSGRSLRFSLKNHLFMVLMGLTLFSTAYWLVYLAETMLTSALVAVVFSSMIFMNVVNGALFLKTKVRWHVVAGGIVGFVGVLLIFWPEIAGFRLNENAFPGFILSLAGVYGASVGNIISARNQNRKMAVIPTNGFAMGYGALAMLALAVILGRPVVFDMSLRYVSSLVYLSLFGSVIAFTCYLTLIGRIGADRAAYASMLFPLVALVLSAVFEGYRWSGISLLGTLLIVGGNFMVIRFRH